MTRDDIRNGLMGVRARMDELVNAARQLENQNFADIAAVISGRLHQLCEHPDLDRVSDKMNGEPQSAPAQNNLESGQAPQPNDAERQKAAELFGTQQERNDFRFNPAPQVATTAQQQNRNGDEDRTTFKPGEPRFQEGNPARNSGFRDPNAVDLNADGSLQRAPNSLGASDVREPGK